MVSCQNSENIPESEEYVALAWSFRSSIDYTQIFTTSTSDTILLLNKFANTASRDILEEIYLSFYEPLEYKINDSILHLLATRPDREYSKDIVPIESPIITIKMISDTSGLSDFIYLSEPLKIDSNWLLFSITRLSGTTGGREHYVSYVEIGDSGRLNLAFIYDWQKDRLMKREVIK